MLECSPFIMFRPNTFITRRRPLSDGITETHGRAAGIGPGSTCQPQKDKPAQLEADGSAARRDPHPRPLLRCDWKAPRILAQVGDSPPPSLPFHKRQADAGPPHDLKDTLSSGPLARAPRGSFALLPGGCAFSSPATERPLQKGGCGFAILSSIFWS